jgi:probable F420-dependent oxidoreductase
MKLGIAMWQTDQGVGVPEGAAIAEQSGIESLFVVSHTHIPVSRPDVIADPVHERDAYLLEQFTSLGAASAVTRTLKLGTCVCIVPQCDTLTLAKQVATIQHLSAGRFLFGVGAGWLAEEMRNHGVDPRRRWDRMGEQIRALRTIWAEDEAEFHGEFVDFDPIWLGPKPDPAPPVLVGGQGERGLRATAEYGDGWMPIVGDAAEFEAQSETLRGLCERAGRPCPPITACLLELDEQLARHLAGLEVDRLAVVAPTADRPGFVRFIERYSQLGEG